MGRLRISFKSALEHANELINNGESETSAIHKAALKFNEDEQQLKNKIDSVNANLSKDSKNESSKKESNNSTNKKTNPKETKSKKTNSTKSKQNWTAYVGPIHYDNNMDLISAKVSNKDAKSCITSLINNKKNTQSEIKDNDWKAFSKEFDSEVKCDRYIKRKSFNNLFPIYMENITSSEEVEVSESAGYNFNKKYKVNKECTSMIERFNQLSEKTFKDYVMLKTFGNDGLSPLRMNDIIKQIPSDELMYAKGEISEEDIPTCLKWRLRGLPIEDAVEKVKIDNMVKNR